MNRGKSVLRNLVAGTVLALGLGACAVEPAPGSMSSAYSYGPVYPYDYSYYPYDYYGDPYWDGLGVYGGWGGGWGRGGHGGHWGGGGGWHGGGGGHFGGGGHGGGGGHR